MKKKKVDPAVSAAAAAMGRKGGQNGRGAAKTRPPQHYLKLAGARQAARLKRIAESAQKTD